MLNRILTGWNVFRILRVAVGVYLLVDGVMSKIWIFAILGLAFSLMAIFNVGGCSTQRCATHPKTGSGADNEEVIYEEVKKTK